MIQWFQGHPMVTKPCWFWMVMGVLWSLGVTAGERGHITGLLDPHGILLDHRGWAWPIQWMSYLSSGFVAFAFSSWLRCSCVVLEMMIFYLSSYLSLLLLTGKIYFTLLGTAYSTKIGGPSISRNGQVCSDATWMAAPLLHWFGKTLIGHPAGHPLDWTVVIFLGGPKSG